MLEIARYEGRKRLKGSIYLSVAMAVFAALVIWVYPSMREAMDIDELVESYPEPLLQLFGIETMASIEGFLAVELYQFGWVILLGLYLAYSAASTIADDVDRGRMDTILAMPVRRSRVVAETFGALAVPIVLVNLIAAPVVYASTLAIDDAVAVPDLLAVHAISVPYLFACAGIGLLASVAVDRPGIAQRVALGVTFGLFMLESLLSGTDFAFVGALTPMRYFAPNDVLIRSSWDLVGVAALVVGTLALLGASQLVFGRRDVG